MASCANLPVLKVDTLTRLSTIHFVLASARVPPVSPLKNIDSERLKKGVHDQFTLMVFLLVFRFYSVDFKRTETLRAEFCTESRQADVVQV